VYLRGILLTTGTVTLEINKAVGGGGTGGVRPAATILGTPTVVNMPLLSLVSQVVYTTVDFDFSDVQLGSTDQEIVLLFKGSGGGCADVRYLNSSSAPADNQQFEYTSNSGSSWSPVAAQVNYNDIRYTILASSPTTTTSEVLTPHYYQDTITVAVAPGTRGGDSVQSTVRLLNSPEVPTP
jgi:hypothetical protein